MIPQIKTENELRKLAGIPIKEAEGGSLDNILAKHRESFESVMRGDSFLYDHDEFYDELYEYFVTGDGRGEMPYGTMKARDGDPDEWIMEYLEREYGNDFATDDGEPMDGDFDSAMASAGMGTDEDYGYYGEGKSHSCATHVEHKEFGKGQCIPTQHSLIETDNGEYKVTHYDIKFGSGIKKNVPVEKLKIIKESHHKHKKAKVVEENKEPKTFKEHLNIVERNADRSPYSEPPRKMEPRPPRGADEVSDSEKELRKPNPSGYEEHNLSRAKRGIWPGALLKATQKYHNIKNKKNEAIAETEPNRDLEAVERSEDRRQAGQIQGQKRKWRLGRDEEGNLKSDREGGGGANKGIEWGEETLSTWDEMKSDERKEKERQKRYIERQKKNKLKYGNIQT